MYKILPIFIILLIVATLIISIATSSSTYKVKSGDTLWKISQKTGVELRDLREANNKWDNMIYIGQELDIPYNAK